MSCLEINIAPSFFLTLTFPVCSGRLAEGGSDMPADIILLLWLACPLLLFSNKHEKHFQHTALILFWVSFKSFSIKITENKRNNNEKKYFLPIFKLQLM